MAKPIAGGRRRRGDAGRHGALNNRFGHDYEVVPDLDGGSATLALGPARRQVALVIAAQGREPADPDDSSAGPTRCIPTPSASSDAPMMGRRRSRRSAMALGQIDDYFVTPWGHPEEKLYPQITELLSAWARTIDRPLRSRWSRSSASSGHPGPTSCAITWSATTCRSGSTPTTPRRGGGCCGKPTRRLAAAGGADVERAGSRRPVDGRNRTSAGVRTRPDSIGTTSPSWVVGRRVWPRPSTGRPRA